MDKNSGHRMTEFRRANQRRMMARKLIGPFVIGGCMAMLAVGIAFAQLNTGAARGTFERPYLVEVLRGGTDEAKAEPELAAEADFQYLGDFEVAAYCSDGRTFTYSGDVPMEGHTAAGALSLFKIGDTVLVDGNRYVIEDKVDENASEKLRIYYDSFEEAMLYGRKTAAVYRHSPDPAKESGFLGTFEVTAYCSCELCCGEKREKLTKTETVPKQGYTIAVDPSVIPLGTLLVIDGVTYLAEDTGNAIKGNRLDIYFDTHEEAVRYGCKEKPVYLKESYNPL